MSFSQFINLNEKRGAESLVQRRPDIAKGKNTLLPDISRMAVVEWKPCNAKSTLTPLVLLPLNYDCANN